MWWRGTTGYGRYRSPQVRDRTPVSERMRKRKGDGVTSGTDAMESGSMVCRNVWRLSFRWWLRLSGMTDTTPLVLWCCGAVVLWCCGAVVLAGVM
ncbi:hypothetical protein AYN54_001188 [Escherichia coli]|nr:hypothetical protein [Escherichia coli]